MTAPNHYAMLAQLRNKRIDVKNSVPTEKQSSSFRLLFDLKADGPVHPLPDPDDADIDLNFFGDNDLDSNEVISSRTLFSNLQQCCTFYNAEEQYEPDDDDSMCTLEEALSMQWQYDSDNDLLNRKNTVEKSPIELMDEIRPVMSKQDLPNAYYNMALLMTKRLPLISIKHSLYHRRGSIYEPIDSNDLYDCLCSITDKSIHGGIKRNGRKELYSSVSSIGSIQVSEDDIVRNPNLIPLIDKIYDIETGRFHETQPNELFFSRINLFSDEVGLGDKGLLERFLDSSFGGDQHVIERFMQVQGVILSPYTPKAIFHYWGPHDTGKSEAVRMVSLFLKPQSKYVHSLDDPNKLTDSFALAPLRGKRLLYCPDASKINFKEPTCAVLKQLTGGQDLIGTYEKHGPYITFVNEAKPLIISNHELRGDFDEAFLSRLVTVPFHQTIPPEKRIPNLAEKIFESRGCFFLAAMQALRRLIEHNFIFAPIDCQPSYVITGAEKGGVVTIGDSIFSFVEECCVLEDQAFSSSQSLFQAYQQFCLKGQLDPIRDKAVFGRTLHAAFPMIENKRTSSYHGFSGIRLVTQDN